MTGPGGSKETSDDFSLCGTRYELYTTGSFDESSPITWARCLYSQREVEVRCSPSWELMVIQHSVEEEYIQMQPHLLGCDFQVVHRLGSSLQVMTQTESNSYTTKVMSRINHLHINLREEPRTVRNSCFAIN